MNNYFGTTYFGRALSEIRARLNFHNKELKSDGVTATDIQTLSRISTRRVYLKRMSEQARKRLIKKIAVRIAKVRPHPVFTKELCEGQLLDAIHLDLNALEVEREAPYLVNKLIELTGRSLEQLHKDVMEVSSIQEIRERWGTKT